MRVDRRGAASVPDAWRRAALARALPAPAPSSRRRAAAVPDAPDGRTRRAAPRPLRPASTATRWSARRWRCAACRTGTAAPIRTGFDCSGFTQYVFAQYGVALPREVREQFAVGKSVKADGAGAGRPALLHDDRPGRRRTSAIAIGGDQFVHAPSSTGVVRVERLSASYWSPRFVGARRVD